MMIDGSSVEFMNKKVKEFEGFIDKCNDPNQLLLLNQARNMFAQTLIEWGSNK